MRSSDSMARAVAVVAFGFLLTAPLFAARNPAMQGANPALASVWEFQAGGALKTIPVLASDGTVYFGCADRKVYAIDSQTGKKRWEFETWAPLHVAPAVSADGTVFVAGREGVLYALDSGTGQQRWVFRVPGAARAPVEIPENNPGRSGPAPASVLAVRAERSRTVFARGGIPGTLYALDGRTGKKRWEVELPPAASGPALTPGDSTLYFTTSSLNPQRDEWSAAVLALGSASGARQWRFAPDPRSVSALTPGVSPGPGGLVYAAGYDRRSQVNWLFALSAGSGRPKWEVKKEQGRNLRAPVFGPTGTLYCVTGNVYWPKDPDAKPAFVYAIDPGSGKTLWVTAPGPLFLSSPAIVRDGTLYIRHERGLLALDPRDGKVAWSYPGGEGTGAVIGPDGTLYYGDGDRLIALRPAANPLP